MPPRRRSRAMAPARARALAARVLARVFAGVLAVVVPLPLSAALSVAASGDDPDEPPSADPATAPPAARSRATVMPIAQIRDLRRSRVKWCANAFIPPSVGPHPETAVGAPWEQAGNVQNVGWYRDIRREPLINRARDGVRATRRGGAGSGRPGPARAAP